MQMHGLCVLEMALFQIFSILLTKLSKVTQLLQKGKSGAMLMRLDRWGNISHAAQCSQVHVPTHLPGM